MASMFIKMTESFLTLYLQKIQHKNFWIIVFLCAILKLWELESVFYFHIWLMIILILNFQNMLDRVLLDLLRIIALPT